ncbi:MAG TPA: homoserine kinase [Vicinamibacterales bacterium]|nr:homoserine kinase [Vicinamibacterales bacterium]
MAETEILVPGSTANLGGGFDTLGVAVQLYLRARIVDVRADDGARLEVVSSKPAVRGTNAVERAFAAIAKRATGAVPTVFAEIESDIPLAAGLGSSAAATVAGLRIFERVAEPVSDTMLLATATALEGHADNAAPALFGGMTSVVEGDRFGEAGSRVRALRWKWPDDLRFVIATPFTGLATATARAALSPTISRKDAVFNLQRVLSLVHALQHGEYDRLREALQDRWHQPARAALVPHLGAVLAIDDPDVLGAYLSGAGPSVAVLARRDFARVERLLQATCEAAGSPVTVRTLAAHQHTTMMRDAVASAPGRTA